MQLPTDNRNVGRDQEGDIPSRQGVLRQPFYLIMARPIKYLFNTDQPRYILAENLDG